jgi:hypothetical protein
MLRIEPLANDLLAPLTAIRLAAGVASKELLSQRVRIGRLHIACQFLANGLANEIRERGSVPRQPPSEFGFQRVIQAQRNGYGAPPCNTMMFDKV